MQALKRNAAGGLLGCVAIGAMFWLPVFLRPIAADTGWSITGVSTAMTIAFASYSWLFFGSFGLGIGQCPCRRDGH